MPRTRRALTASLLSTALTAAVLAVAPAPADAAPAQATYQRTAFAATNGQRVHQDLKALTKQKCLQKFATQQAKRMAARQEMYHQDIGIMGRKCRLSAYGENVAYGYASGASVVRDGWMHSVPHRANILNQDYRLMAIGARRGSDGSWYVSQVFGRR